MRVPTYGTVVSVAAAIGVLAFVGFLVIQAPPLSPPPTRAAAAPDRPRENDADDIERWLRENPERPAARYWLLLGNLRHAEGRAAEAERAWREALRRYEQAVTRTDLRQAEIAWYNLACCRARLGDRAGAIDALRRAVEAGWGDPRATREDTDFESLRGDPAFEEILRTMPERPRVINAG